MTVRVDKWLWSVRVFKTRTAASAACTSGKVRVNGEVAKPATKVAVGDVVEARRGDRQVIYHVIKLTEKRVGAELAQGCYDDHSPPSSRRISSGDVFAPPGGSRDRGAGRPTKRDRRKIDKLRGRQ